MPEADFAALDAVGLNLHAVFALDQLPMRCAMNATRRAITLN